MFQEREEDELKSGITEREGGIKKNKIYSEGKVSTGNWRIKKELKSGITEREGEIKKKTKYMHEEKVSRGTWRIQKK